MSLRKLKSMLMIAAVALAAASCKEDDEVEYKYLDGSLLFDLPEFVTPGTTLTITPRGISHPEDEAVGYYWKVTPTMSSNDTTKFLNGLDADGKPSDGSLTHKFSDTLQTYTVNCFAFADGYSASTKSNYTTVVSAGLEKSITGTGISQSDPYIKANGQEFYYTTIGNLDWFRNDLAYTESGVPFRNSTAMDGVFGRYYSYEDAVKACPEGWRLPTDADWASLAAAYDSTDKDASSYVYQNVSGVAPKLIADVYFNGYKMWEYWPSMGKITNESRFGMISTGYANLGEKDENGKYPSAEFVGEYEYAAYWTADKVEGKTDMAYFRYVYCKYPDFMIGKADTKTFGAAVRCVRDAI